MNWNKRETAWKKKLKKWTEKKKQNRSKWRPKTVLLGHSIPSNYKNPFLPPASSAQPYYMCFHTRVRTNNANNFENNSVSIWPWVFLYKRYEWLTHWLCDNVLPLALVYWKLDVLFIKVWNSANFIETGLQNHQCWYLKCMLFFYYFALRISLSFRRRYAIETHRTEKFSGSPLVAVEQIELQLN